MSGVKLNTENAVDLIKSRKDLPLANPVAGWSSSSETTANPQVVAVDHSNNEQRNEDFHALNKKVGTCLICKYF